VAVFGNLTLNRVGLGYSIKVASHDAIAATKTTLFGVVPDLQIAARAHAHATTTVVRIKPGVKLHRHVARPVRHA
jgi:hypothetical protein